MNRTEIPPPIFKALKLGRYFFLRFFFQSHIRREVHDQKEETNEEHDHGGKRHGHLEQKAHRVKCEAKKEAGIAHN